LQARHARGLSASDRHLARGETLQTVTGRARARDLSDRGLLRVTGADRARF
jgi:hypothetical protein